MLTKESPDESNYDGIVDLVSEDDSVECMEVLMAEGAKQRVLLHRYFSKVICLYGHICVYISSNCVNFLT